MNKLGIIFAVLLVVLLFGCTQNQTNSNPTNNTLGNTTNHTNTATQSQNNTNLYISDKDNFSIAFPGTPQEDDYQNNSSVYSVTGPVQGNSSFLDYSVLVWKNYGGSTLTDAQKLQLAIDNDRNVYGKNGTFTVNDAANGSLTGKETFSQNLNFPNMPNRIRLFIVNGNLYEIIIQASNLDSSNLFTQDSNNFIDSFQINQ